MASTSPSSERRTLGSCTEARATSTPPRAAMSLSMVERRSATASVTRMRSPRNIARDRSRWSISVVPAATVPACM